MNYVSWRSDLLESNCRTYLSFCLQPLLAEEYEQLEMEMGERNS